MSICVLYAVPAYDPVPSEYYSIQYSTTWQYLSLDKKIEYIGTCLLDWIISNDYIILIKTVLNRISLIIFSIKGGFMRLF